MQNSLRIIRAEEMSLSTFNNVNSVIRDLRPSHSILCFNPDRISARVDEFKKGFPGTVSWAVKSNPHPEVIRSIVNAGIAEFDVASRSEIEQMRYQAPSSILHFNHPIKSPEDISFSYFTAGVRNFVVDCIEEVEKIIGVLGAGGKTEFSDITLLVRFKVPEFKGSNNYNFGEKFGAVPIEASEIIRSSFEKGFQVGLTFHPGSQNMNPEVYKSMMDIAYKIAHDGLRDKAHELKRLNVGGGFPCVYPNDKKTTLAEYFNAIGRGILNESVEIICEPGRALVADSINVLTRVTLRRQNDLRVYINDGFYGSFMELPFVDFMPPARAYSPDGFEIQALENEQSEYSIWGPTCDSLDKLPKKVRLPSKLRTGDYIEFGLMGAYTNATQTGFNGILPADLVIVNHLQSWDNPACKL